MLRAIDEENNCPTENQVCISIDATALYPSLNREETAKVCAELVVESGLWFRAIDWEELGLYLVLTGRVENLDPDCLPSRKYTGGQKPMITTAEVLGPITRDREKSKFLPPLRSPNEVEQRAMLHNMVNEGIRTVMTNHTYSWNGEIRLQSKGGGIGDKLAGEAARLYLVSFDRRFVSTINESNLQMTLYKRYVDDGNIKGQIVPRGYTWNATSNSLILTLNPEADTRPPGQRTAEAFQAVANSITSMLKWTADFPEAHDDQKLPVLDLALWCMETSTGTITLYEFYMKPTSSLVSIPANSALPVSTKFSAYRQEVFRILRNTSVSLPWAIKAKHLSDLSWRMHVSGYQENFRG